jgi:hypothetical protein
VCTGRSFHSGFTPGDWRWISSSQEPGHRDQGDHELLSSPSVAMARLLWKGPGMSHVRGVEEKAIEKVNGFRIAR